MAHASTFLDARPRVVVCRLGVLGMAPEVLAQAGGGGGFGGGGGGGGGDGGDWWVLLFRVLLWLVREHPAVGVPTVLFVALLFWWSSLRGADRWRSRAVGRGRLRRSQARTDAAAERLRKLDPGFDAAKFHARVRTAFHKAQDAWCRQDLQPLRPFVSDGVHERFSLQIAEQRQDGWQQGMDGTAVTYLAITHHGSDLHFDTITVQVGFHARIYRRFLDTGKEVPGSELPWREFSECWSFLRRRGVATGVQDGLIEGHCPNCGASLAMNQSAKCESCDSVLRSGQYDWVLVEITQSSEWRPEDARSVPGVEAFQQRDREFNVPSMEDLASVMFWRQMAADRLDGTGPLARIATPAFLERREAARASRGEAPRRYVTDVAVGSVRTLGVLSGAEVDRVIVQIRWDGHAVQVQDSGETRRSSRGRIRTTRFVLVRRRGVLTALGDAIQSAHCRSCGAPEADGVEPVCGYCGVVWNDGDAGWRLDAVYQATDPGFLTLEREVRALGNGAPSRGLASIVDLLHWTIRAAAADGVIEEEERDVLRSLARRCHVTDGQLARLEGLLPAEPHLLAQPADRDEGRRWLAAMIRHCLEDGRLSRAERRILEQAGQDVGYHAWDVRQLIRATNKELFHESRRARRRPR